MALDGKAVGIVDDFPAAKAMTARTSIWLAGEPYGPYTSVMPKKSYGAEEARTLLPELLERAHRGEHSVITKRGKPYAEVVPVGSSTHGKPRLSFLSLAGTGHGLWGHESRKTLKRLRDEWR